MQKTDVEYNKNGKKSIDVDSLIHIDSEYYSRLSMKVISDFYEWKEKNEPDFNDFFREIAKDYQKFKKANTFKKAIALIDKVISPQANRNRFTLFNEAKLLLKNAPKSAFYRNFRDYASVNIEENIDKLLPKKLYKNLQEYLKYPTIQNTSDLLYLENYNLITDIMDNPKFIDNLLQVFEKRFKVDLTKDFASYETLREIHIFLRDYLRKLMDVIPEGSLNKSGIGKFFKVIIGVVIFSKENMPIEVSKRDECIKRIFKIGMFWSLTYPLFDNIIDTNNELKEEEINKISTLVMKALNEDDVSSEIPQIPYIQILYDALYQLTLLLPIRENSFLYKSIEIFYNIHINEIQNKPKNLEELIQRKIIKSALVRIITATLSKKTITEEFIINSFYIGLHNQLEDDFQDIIEDISENVSTIFTDERYKSQSLEYFINYNMFLIAKFKSEDLHISLKDNFYERIKLLCENQSQTEFENLIRVYGKTLNDKVLDKIIKISRHYNGINYQLEEYSMLNYLDKKSNEIVREINRFENFYKYFKKELDIQILINSNTSNEIVEAMNYSLSGKSKRLRPLLAAIVADENGINLEKLMPLFKAIEYFHTATLIFDDLPAQDNSEFRRGKKTLHIKHKEYTAQLAGIALISEGYKCLSELDYDAGLIKNLIRYASETSDYKNMIYGQFLDLSFRKDVREPNLVELAFLKTGLAIEFAVVSPLLLNSSQEKINYVKEFAKHLSIAFQIRDDILDFTKSFSETYKSENLDIMNNAKTFISEFGLKKSKEMFEEHINKSKHQLNLFAKENSMMNGIYEYLKI